jgi:hypothetical protein
MLYLMFREVQARATLAGLVMSRHPRTGHINLRYRDPRVSQQVWRDVTVGEALAVVGAVLPAPAPAL